MKAVLCKKEIQRVVDKQDPKRWRSQRYAPQGEVVTRHFTVQSVKYKLKGYCLQLFIFA